MRSARDTRRLTRDNQPNLVVEANRLRSVRSGASELAADELFVVVVLWDEDATRWVGWLTTFDRRSLCFSPADLENVEFQRWLAELAGWKPSRLTAALGQPGLHLVWRDADS